jgi:alpha-L-arabinofuranosidase
MAELVPDYDLPIAPLEENGARYDMHRALAHAHNYNTVARMGDYFPAIAVANTFQAYKQNLIWPQGRTFFTASQVWFQPPYYVDRMISRNWAANIVETEFAAPQGALDAVAKITDDGKMLVLQVVNVEPEAVETKITIEGFSPSSSPAVVVEIRGDLDGENTPEEPEKIAPTQRKWRHALEDGETTYTFPPHSFTILRL